MSRSYCRVCHERHKNGARGVCDKHLDYEQNQRAEEYRQSPIGQALDDVTTLDEMKDWIRENWKS